MALRCSGRESLAACLLLAAGFIQGCLQEDRVLLAFDGFEPETTGDGWEVASPEDEGFDREALEDVFRQLHDSDLWQLRSLLVFRHGRLVAESYFKDDGDRTTRRAIWSATKQLVGILIGVAIQQGVLDGVEQPLADCIQEIPERYPDKRELTLRHLLEMQSGIAYDNDGAGGHTSRMLRRVPKDSARFILDLPMRFEPGQQSDYHDGNPHLLSICMQRKTGEPLDRWADANLLSLIGFTNYRWRRYRDGTTLGGFGILTTPRELAKIAQLVLQDGRWKDTRLVSAEWVAEMTMPRVDTYDERYRFGYQWWYALEQQVSFMDGHGGQYAFIDRETSTLVVITSEPNTQDDHQIRAPRGLAIFDDIRATLQP